MTNDNKQRYNVPNHEKEISVVVLLVVYIIYSNNYII